MRYGVCKLCLRKEELRDSHFIPRAMYKYLRTASEKNPNPVVVGRTRAATTSKQVKDYLLCAKCEDLFNKNGENEILKWVWNSKHFPLGDRLAVAVPLSLDPSVTPSFSGTSIGVDTEKFAYFALSLIWRAAVHVWDLPFGGKTTLLNLGAIEEPIRKYLLGTVAFPSEVVVVATACTDPLSIQSFSAPSQVIGFQGTCFAILALGIYFRVLIGSDIPPESRKICCAMSKARLIFQRDCSQKTFGALAQIILSP
jgi:hypothetical protein